MGRWIDISMSISEGQRTNHSRPGQEIRITYDVRPEDTPQRKTVRRIDTRLHIGTHMDGPEHLIEGARRLDTYPVDRFTGPAVIADLRHKAPHGIIKKDDLEKAFGDRLGKGDVAILRTDWNRRYFEADFFSHSPWSDPDTADWFAARGAKMVVVDYLCDPLDEKLHRGVLDAFKTRLLGHDILVVTNADNLHEVRKDRVWLYAFPIKIVPSEAAPTRAVIWED